MMVCDSVHATRPLPPRACRVELETRLSELERAAAWLAATQAQLSVPDDVAFAVAVCVEEALANIVMYGGAENGEGHIALTLTRAPRSFVLTIEDDGSPFDPTSVPRSSVPQSLAQAQVGQVGVHLMRSFAAGMRYREHQGRNILTLTFPLAAGA